MKIAVLVKEVPDTWGDRRIDPATKRVDRSSDEVVDEVNEKAVEIALQVQSANPGSEVTVVTMGPKGALDGLRKALSMGADNAIHLLDDGLVGSDAVQTSAALAAALAPRGFDLVIAGNESTDGRTAAVPAMLAERLNVAQLTNLRTLTRLGNRGDRRAHHRRRFRRRRSVAARRRVGHRADRRGPLPELQGHHVGQEEAGRDPRRRPTWDLDAADTGADHSWSVVLEVGARPARSGGTVITDDGTAATQLADYLAAAKLI